MPDRLTLERTYSRPVEQLWSLWTTKDGIESWWGPEGFDVTVQELDLRVGGALDYTMTATGPEQVAFMEQAGMPLSSPVSLTYTEVEPVTKLSWSTLTDFIPDVEPYDVNTTVEFEQQGDAVRMVLTFDAMHDDVWTERSRMGEEMQLQKLDALLGVGSER